MIKYELLRSARKTTCISIERDGSVVVKAPFFAKQSEIDAFVLSKSKWIEKTVRHVLNKKRPPVFKDGSEYFIAGEIFVVKIYEGARAFALNNVIYIPKKCVLKNKTAFAPAEFIGIVKKLFFNYAKNRAATLSAGTGLCFKSLKISGARSRWGSCSAQNDINLSVFLAFLPCELIDYVIVHELCHVRQKNHLREFWDLVGSFLPDYKEKRKSLSDYSSFLAI